MNLAGPTSGGIAGAVWTNATRSLTNTGPMLTQVAVPFATLAGNATVDLRVAAGHVGEINLAMVNGAGSAAVIALQQYDGSNIITMQQTSGSPGSSNWQQMLTASAVGPRLANFDATHAGNYMYAGYTWTL